MPNSIQVCVSARFNGENARPLGSPKLQKTCSNRIADEEMRTTRNEMLNFCAAIVERWASTDQGEQPGLGAHANESNADFEIT